MLKLTFKYLFLKKYFLNILMLKLFKIVAEEFIEGGSGRKRNKEYIYILTANP